MDMPQPARLAYGLPDQSTGEEEKADRGTWVALAVLVVALAAAVLGYVAYPAFRAAPPPVARSCEVVVLATGSPECVEDPARVSAVKAKAGGTARPAKGSRPRAARVPVGTD